MNGNAHAGFNVGNFLALQDPLADLNNGLRRITDVLLKWQNQLGRHAGIANRTRG